ncbi:MAG TPA: tetratricopeptide repeat protein [Candidatus Angelobacter sp.]|jgi:tetratricopeptide (TPR) repeat protein|nr:tetratricopeptide repeat protein [Candidatus Angelobacter sp.]
MALVACGGGAAAPVTHASPGAGVAAVAVADGTEQLIAATQAHLRSAPDDVQALDTLAAAYLQRVREVGDPSYYAKADDLLGSALGLSPHDGEATLLSGTLALARHRFTDALAWGQRAALLDPHGAGPLGVITDAQVELGRYGDAVATVQQMVDVRPDLASYSRVSYLRELHGDVAGAITAMGMAVTAGGPVAENVAYVQVLLGNLSFNSGDLASAETQYQAALQQDPGYVHAEAALAKVRAAQGRVGEAAALYRTAVATYPLPQYVIALGDVLTASGDSAGAAQQYDLAAAEDTLLSATGGVDVDQELALFDADHHRDLPGALAAAQRAMRDRPSVQSADVLAWTLFQSGDLHGALDAMHLAHRLGTRDALMFFHSGMIEAALGMAAQARDDLSTALSINPSFSVLQSGMARSTLEGLSR